MGFFSLDEPSFPSGAPSVSASAALGGITLPRVPSAEAREDRTAGERKRARAGEAMCREFEEYMRTGGATEAKPLLLKHCHELLQKCANTGKDWSVA